MVHQYAPDSRTTTLEHAYDDLIKNIPDTQQRSVVVNKALGKAEIDPTKVGDDVISLFNPHADYVRAYNERAVKEEKRLIREKEKQLYNEAGQAYEQVWKNDSFKSIHDPLSIIIITQTFMKRKLIMRISHGKCSEMLMTMMFS